MPQGYEAGYGYGTSQQQYQASAPQGYVQPQAAPQYYPTPPPPQQAAYREQGFGEAPEVAGLFHEHMTLAEFNAAFNQEARTPEGCVKCLVIAAYEW